MLTQSLDAWLLRRCACLAGFVFVGCHGGPGGVSFQGRPRAAVALPEQILETRSLPSGVTRLGSVRATCRTPERWQAFREQSLADVDCSEARLRRMLREAAAQNGGDVLAGVSCDANGSLACSAVVGRGARAAARDTGGTRPPAVSGDVRGSRGADVLVDFVPLIADPARPARTESVVGDIPLLPPSHVVAATLATACTQCSELEARDALRIAAARSGASDVVGVRCFQWGPGYRCAGSAAMTQVVP